MQTRPPATHANWQTVSPTKQNTEGLTLSPGGGGGHSLVMGYWGFAAGQGCIFTTRLTTMGSPFQAFSIELLVRNGVALFRDFESKKIICPKVTNMAFNYNWPQNRPEIDYNGVGVLRCQQHIPSKT